MTQNLGSTSNPLSMTGEQWVLEERTDDPLSPEPGECWIRTDLNAGDKIATLKFGDGSEVPIFPTGTSEPGVLEVRRVQTGGQTGYLPVSEPDESRFPQFRLQHNNTVYSLHDDIEPRVIPDSGLYLDDWEDERLSNRLFYDEVEYAFDAPEESAFDDPVRAEWTVESGDPTTTGGLLIVTDAEGVSVFCDATAFTLHIEWQFADAPSSSAGLFNVMTSEPGSRFPSDGYAVNVDSNGDYFLRERSSAADIITGQWDADDLPHTTTLTRSSAGEWELFYDSTSVGNATDTTTDSAGNFAIYAPNDPADWEITRFEVF